MSVLVDENTKVIVQGITGKHGSFHAKLMKEYGTDVVAGVTPGKKGQEVEGVKVYGSVAEALDEHEANWSVIFVPAKFAKDAALESLRAGLNVVVITEGVPVHDEIEIVNFAKQKKLFVVGPNCPGVISPGKSKLGIMPGHIFSEGNVGVVSRSGTLTYEIINELTRSGMGQSTAIGMGGDPVVGVDFLKALELFEADAGTERIVLIGEIGGDLEERSAKFIEENVRKKAVAYIAGVSAPKGKKMGHAGAVICGESGTAESKIHAFEEAGVQVATLPSDIPRLLKA